MRPIDADELLTAFPVDDEPTLTKSCVRMTIQHMPTVDAVPRGAYDQVRWERDIALGQLKQLGYELGGESCPGGAWEVDTVSDSYGIQML